jgi:hypothetical protein
LGSKELGYQNHDRFTVEDENDRQRAMRRPARPQKKILKKWLQFNTVSIQNSELYLIDHSPGYSWQEKEWKKRDMMILEIWKYLIIFHLIFCAFCLLYFDLFYSGK